MRRWTAALEAAQITVKQSGFRASFFWSAIRFQGMGLTTGGKSLWRGNANLSLKLIYP